MSRTSVTDPRHSAEAAGSDPAPPRAWVGRSRAAQEAQDIVTGSLTYVTDRVEPGMLHARVLRSPVPHARLVRVDATRARQLPGVVCVLTAADVPVNALGPRPEDGPVLAEGRVRQVGEPIALVAAEDEAAADLAVRAIELELADLPVIDGPAAARQAGAHQLHDSGNVSAHLAFAAGDVAAALAAADLVVRRDCFTPSQEHVAIETPGGLAMPDGEGVVIWCGSQNPGLHRRKVARALAVEPEQVRLVANPVGGAFGSRNDDPTPVHLALLARFSGRPVHLHMTREETMAAGAKRHPFWSTIEVGFDREGHLLGSRMTAVSDTGPVVTSGPNVMKTSAEMSAGPYRVGATSFDGTVYYTNNANAGAFRGYGVPQVAFAVETAMTEAAWRLGIDPLVLRLRNALTGADPHPLYRHRMTDSLQIRATLELARSHPLWEQRDAWRESGEWPWRRGTGIATAMKGVGMGSGSGDVARARLLIDRQGTLTIWAGPNHTGQSIHTTYGQVAADVLGVDIDRIDVRVGDTDEVLESGPTAASRSLYAGGNAVSRVCEAFLARCRDLALPVDTDLVTTGAKLVELGESEFVATFFLPDVEDAGLVGSEDLARFGPHRVYGACTQVVRVEVNTVTGELRVPQVLCVVDCGTPVNPGATVGQAVGGVLQGLGFALMENHRLEDGVPVTTSLENYLIPTILDTPAIEVQFVDSYETTGPFGAKGMSEVVVVPTGPAVAGAVLDATGVLPHELPLDPERMLSLLGGMA